MPHRYRTSAALRAVATAMAASLAAMAATPALAQTAPASDNASASASDKAAPAVADIVVTAQFRSQKLQDTPLAITAITGASLAARSASQISDVSDAAPGVLVKPSSASFGPALTVFMRGVGQGDSSFAMEPGVSMYIDDVYFGSLFGANFDLLDLDRVEMLRGPQGTLAGKNSIGGAIKLYTRKPDGHGSNFAEVTYGSRNLASFRGGADITLVPDKLYGRISGVFTRQDGYLTRYDYGCLYPNSGVPAAGTAQNCVLGHEGGKNYGGGRLALRYTPTSNLSVDLAGTVIRDTSEVAPTELLGVTATSATYFAPYNPSLFVVPSGANYNYATYSVPSFTDPAAYNGKTGAGTHPATSVPDHNDLLQTAYTGTVNWTIADSLSLTSITGYSHTRVSYGIDGDASPAVTQNALYQALSNQVSQELRLNGRAFGRFLDWTVGGYYYHAHNNFSGSNILYPGKAFENLNAPDDDVISQNKSVFAQLIAHPSERLTLTGGLRYTDDSKVYTYRRYNPFLPGVPTFTASGVLTGVVSNYHADKVDYRANLQYRWNDNVMTYAQVATGFRGGGTNPRPYVPEQAVPFSPETITAFELGIKTDLFDRRLRLNASLFRNDYSNIIFTNTAPTANSALNATPTNVGTAHYEGVEVEMTARPIAGLTIEGSASYLHFKLDSISAAGVVIQGVTLSSQAPFAPKWKANIGAQYAIQTRLGTVTPRLDYTYQSSYFTAITDDPQGQVGAYALVNARIGFDAPGRQWHLALAVRNLLDTVYYNNKFYNLGMTLAQPAAPREVSVTLRRDF
ncbi:MAG TPA: TonB-dependent receptor [Novosphingobium sp.]|nr:TonB-dependent receptor [Novosphingobium sp.]